VRSQKPEVRMTPVCQDRGGNPFLVSVVFGCAKKPRFLRCRDGFMSRGGDDHVAQIPLFPLQRGADRNCRGRMFLSDGWSSPRTLIE